jgi:hypothetical protein
VRAEEPIQRFAKARRSSLESRTFAVEVIYVEPVRNAPVLSTSKPLESLRFMLNRGAPPTMPPVGGLGRLWHVVCSIAYGLLDDAKENRFLV